MEEASRTYTKEIRDDQYAQLLIKLIKGLWSVGSATDQADQDDLALLADTSLFPH
jgi:hypothetical protein